MMMGTSEKEIEQQEKQKQVMQSQKQVFVEDLSIDEQSYAVFIILYL